jgi:hypothetical protein
MHRRAGRGGGHRGSAVKRRRGDKRPRVPAYGMIAAAPPAAGDQGQPRFARLIKADYGVSDVFADAWSAPAFMKTNDSAINGGTVRGVPGARSGSGDWRQACARCLARYARDYAAAGVPLTCAGPENETTITPPQEIMSPARTADLTGIPGPRGPGGAHVTPYPAGASRRLSARPPVTVRDGAFTATLPPRSLVTCNIRS